MLLSRSEQVLAGMKLVFLLQTFSVCTVDMHRKKDGKSNLLIFKRY